MTTYEILVIIILFATMIAILIAPIVGEFARVRISQARLNPETNQPAKRNQSKGGRVQRFLASRVVRAGVWVVWLLGMLEILHLALRAWKSPAPVTRGSVVAIAALVAWFILQLFMAVVIFLFSRVLEILAIQYGQLEYIRGHEELTHLQGNLNAETIEILRLMAELLQRLFIRLPAKEKSTESLLDKMLSGLKKLTKDS